MILGSNLPHDSHDGRLRYQVILILYAAAFLLVVIPVAAGIRAAEASFDETRCYLPAITQLRDKFPAVDLVEDSLSASPPGYTHLLAGLSLGTGDSLAAHRAWHGLVSLFGALLLLWLVTRLTKLRAPAIAAMLPMVCSSYYLKCATQLTTDNPAVILTFGVLAFVLFTDGRPRNALISCALAATAVYVRHISVWVAGPMMLRSLTLAVARKFNSAAAWLVAAIGVLLLVVMFALAWGGLVPPRWAKAHDGISLVSVVYCLSLSGIFGAFFLHPGWRWNLDKKDWLAMATGCVVACVVFFLSETSPSYEAGRWGGPLWSVAEKLPLYAGRSYIFLPLAAIGGGMLSLAFRQLYLITPEKAILWAGAIGAWLATGVVNRQIFHRYYESPILGFWGMWLLLMVLAGRQPQSAVRSTGLYVLAALLFFAGVYSILSSATGFSAPLIGQLPTR